MNAVIPRYEYRIFGLQEIEAVVSALKQKGEFEKQRNIEEIYLMTAGNANNNIKIRNKNLDIKVLVEQADGLEQWKPYNVGLFPLHKDHLKHQVFPALGVELPYFDREVYKLEQFIKELVLDDPDILVALTEKVRYGYYFNGCICEIAEVKINGALLKSVAVESENPEKVIETIAMLGMNNFENVNYPKAIKRVLGLEINYDINIFF